MRTTRIVLAAAATLLVASCVGATTQEDAATVAAPAGQLPPAAGTYEVPDTENTADEDMRAWALQAYDPMLDVFESMERASQAAESGDLPTMAVELVELDVAIARMRDIPCPDPEVDAPLSAALTSMADGTDLALRGLAEQEPDLLAQAGEKFDTAVVQMEIAVGALETRTDVLSGM